MGGLILTISHSIVLSVEAFTITNGMPTLLFSVDASSAPALEFLSTKLII